MRLDVNRIVKVMSQKQGYNYTQRDLAADLNCSYQSVTNWKRNGNPSASQVNRILNLTNLKFDEIWL